MLSRALPLFLAFLSCSAQAQTVTDIDGNSYPAVSIGSQLWMQENLRTTRFSNGDLIPTTDTPVNNDSNTVFQWIYDQDTTNVAIYGRLYSWYAVIDERNVCPNGWHVPAVEEWQNLATFLGGQALAGDLMKEPGTAHWAQSAASVTNASGFTALPAGFRANPEGFVQLQHKGIFWTSTPWGLPTFPRAFTYGLEANSSALDESVAVANCGFSVRCVRNTPVGTSSLQLDKGQRIYPNPFTDAVQIQLPEAGSFALHVYDAEGRIVYAREGLNQTAEISLGFLPAGAYSLVIEQKEKRQTFTLLKQ